VQKRRDSRHGNYARRQCIRAEQGVKQRALATFELADHSKLESIRREPLAQTVQAFKELQLTGGRAYDRRGCLGKQIGEDKIEDRAAIHSVASTRPLSGPESAPIVFLLSQSAHSSSDRLQFSVLPNRRTMWSCEFLLPRVRQGAARIAFSG
jgi:hypothetical protein